MKSPVSPRRAATIKDVARELELSVATVSRALTKPHLLRPATVTRVQAAVKKLGYRPNLVAQNLKLRTTGIVYVIVPSLSPFFLEVFRGTEQAARERGYSVVMGHTDRSPEREGIFFDQVACGRADGVLLVSTAEAEAIAHHKHPLPPTVVVLEAVDGQVFPAVRVDHRKAAQDATAHLIALGHRHIAHITGPDRSPMAIHRREGFLAAMKAAGLQSDDTCCVPGEFTVASGERAMAELLALPHPPTAVFAANDEMAVGAIRVIKGAGLQVPRDISVMGFDDQRIAAIYDPPLSTVHLPTVALGYNAMVKLCRILADEEYEMDVILDTTLVQRGTTAPPPAG